MKLNKQLKEAKPGCLVIKTLPLSKETKTESGLIIPSTNEDSKSGLIPAEVIKVGPDFLNYEMVCEEGDKILITKTCVSRGDRFFEVKGHKYYQIVER